MMRENHNHTEEVKTENCSFRRQVRFSLQCLINELNCKLRYNFISLSISILIKHIVGLYVCLFVCLSVCLSVRLNLSRLKSERHETRHVGTLGTWECLRLNGILNFDLEV